MTDVVAGRRLLTLRPARGATTAAAPAAARAAAPRPAAQPTAGAEREALGQALLHGDLDSVAATLDRCRVIRAQEVAGPARPAGGGAAKPVRPYGSELGAMVAADQLNRIEYRQALLQKLQRAGLHGSE